MSIDNLENRPQLSHLAAAVKISREFAEHLEIHFSNELEFHPRRSAISIAFAAGQLAPFLVGRGHLESLAILVIIPLSVSKSKAAPINLRDQMNPVPLVKRLRNFWSQYRAGEVRPSFMSIKYPSDSSDLL